jgi:predicted nucleotidyltransferase
MPIHLESIQPEYRPGLALLGERLVAYFGDRLAAIFLTGSVAFHEAVPGVSDIDLFIFLTDEPGDEDTAWFDATLVELTALEPLLAECHRNLFSLARLEREEFWRYACRYNALQVYGSDVLAALEAHGVVIPAPSPAWARARAGFTRRILASLRGGVVPDYLYTPPADPHLAARKLARYFVIVEGAYLLMADGAFTSFRTADVLPALRTRYPQWADLWETTAALLDDPHLTAGAYLPHLLPFVEWMVDRIAASEG